MRKLPTILHTLSRFENQAREESSSTARQVSASISLAIETDNAEPDTIASLIVLVFYNFRRGEMKEAKTDSKRLYHILNCAGSAVPESPTSKPSADQDIKDGCLEDQETRFHV